MTRPYIIDATARMGAIPVRGHRQSITPMVSHYPQTPAGRANRARRLEAEARRARG